MVVALVTVNVTPADGVAVTGAGTTEVNGLAVAAKAAGVRATAVDPAATASVSRVRGSHFRTVISASVGRSTVAW
jgi:hypothetical protein